MGHSHGKLRFPFEEHGEGVFPSFLMMVAFWTQLLYMTTLVLRVTWHWGYRVKSQLGLQYPAPSTQPY